MQISKIAVSNQFSVNQNQKMNVNKNNPNFGERIVTSLASNNTRPNLNLLRDKMLACLSACKIAPDNVSSCCVDEGRVLLDVNAHPDTIRGFVAFLADSLKRERMDVSPILIA